MSDNEHPIWYKRTPIVLAVITGVFGLLTTVVTISLTRGNGAGNGPDTAPPPVVAAFEVEPNAIPRGEMASLAWRVENAEGAVIEPDVGAVALEGSWSVQPDETTVYRIVARGAETSVQAAAALNVLSPPDPVSSTEANPPAAATPPVISRFSVSPDKVEAGASANLAWAVDNADSVAISPGVDSTAVRGSQTVSPSRTTVYTLEARGEGGRRVATATVNVARKETSPPAPPQTPPPTVSQFRAGPDAIKAGEKATLSWSVSGVSSVEIQPEVGKARPQGSHVVSPTKSTVYRLTAKGGNQSVRAAARVTVESATVSQKALLKLEKIQTFEDGSVGTTRWIFKIGSGGKQLFVLPQRRYSDRDGASVYQPSDGASTIVTPEADGSIELEVKGSRTGSSSANAFAYGKGTVSLAPGAVRFKVANASKPDEGSFVFYFSLKKLSSTYLPNLRRTLQVARPN